jgi:mannose-6-phosphate isomerase-like protein (cupin superfamily)
LRHAVADFVDRISGAHEARRIVTGHQADGTSVVLSDGRPPRYEHFGDLTYIEVWRSKTAPAVLASGMATEPTDGPLTLAQPGGSVFRLVDYLPASMGGHRTPMHRTATLDYCIVLQGEIVLILDKSEVMLKAGDVVVQQGANHAWENRSNRLARIAFVMLDATFSPALRSVLHGPEIVP